MIVFELTMLNRNSWNGRWSGENDIHVIAVPERKVRKFLWDKDYYYSWSDGWTACVTCKRIPSAEARKLEKKSVGFCGYNWMVDSIIHFGSIMTRSEQTEYLREELGKKVN